MTIELQTVLETSAYAAKAAKLMTARERSDVIYMVAKNPLAGDLIKGTGGLRKLRIALQGRGKSGGARIIYWFHSSK